MSTSHAIAAASNNRVSPYSISTDYANAIEKMYAAPPVRAMVKDFVLTRGEGLYAYGACGEKYADWSAQWGPLALGYGHPEVNAAAIAQIQSGVSHADSSLTKHPAYLLYAKRLVDKLGGDYQVFMGNSGAEAVENAIKIARGATGREWLLAFEGGFHGRTYGGLTATHKPVYKEGFGPFLQVVHAPYADTYQNPKPWPIMKAEIHNRLQNARDPFNNPVRLKPEDVAAILVEPVQGEGGFKIPQPDFLPGLEQFANQNGILLVADEVQTGFRTGQIYAHKHWEIEPDIVTLGKCVGAGFPLSVVLAKSYLYGKLKAENPLGTTTGGSPVACAAGLAQLDVIVRDRLFVTSWEIGRRMTTGFRKLQEEFSKIGDVRNKGSMVAVEFVQDRKAKEPDPDKTARVQKRMIEKGILVATAGYPQKNVLRFLPPFGAGISRADIDHLIDVTREAIMSA